MALLGGAIQRRLSCQNMLNSEIPTRTHIDIGTHRHEQLHKRLVAALRTKQQRRDSVSILHIDLAALLDKVLHNVVLLLESGHEERRLTSNVQLVGLLARRRVVEISAVLHEALDHLEVANLTRQQKRRGAEAGDRVRVGAAVEQRLDHLILTGLDGRIQRGPARYAALLGLDTRRRYLGIGALGQQQLHNVVETALTRYPEHTHAVVVRGIGVGAPLKQILDNLEVALFGRAEQRRLSAQVHAERGLARRRQLHIRATIAQIAHALIEALLAGQHESGYAALILMVGIGEVLQEKLDRLGVVIFGGADERCAAGDLGLLGSAAFGCRVHMSAPLEQLLHHICPADLGNHEQRRNAALRCLVHINTRQFGEVLSEGLVFAAGCNAERCEAVRVHHARVQQFRFGHADRGRVDAARLRHTRRKLLAVVGLVGLLLQVAVYLVHVEQDLFESVELAVAHRLEEFGEQNKVVAFDQSGGVDAASCCR